MKNMVAVADAINNKINRIIKTLEKRKAIHGTSEVLAILECLKVYDIRINTDREVYLMFNDKEYIKLDI